MCKRKRKKIKISLNIWLSILNEYNKNLVFINILQYIKFWFKFFVFHEEIKLRNPKTI